MYRFYLTGMSYIFYHPHSKSDEIMERSTVIIAYWYVIFTFAALAIYMAVNY